MNTNELITKLHSETIEKQQKINELQERIDKAIEFLKLAQESGLISISTLMKILKGE